MDDFSRFFIFSFIENWTSMQIAQKSVSKSIQNECAADTVGGVQRGLGMLPQQAIYEDWPRGEIKKMSKPVQVYTARQFVSPQIFPAFSKAVHKNFGKNILMRYKRMNIIWLYTSDKRIDFTEVRRWI